MFEDDFWGVESAGIVCTTSDVKYSVTDIAKDTGEDSGCRIGAKRAIRPRERSARGRCYDCLPA